ncbi:hypothetical protein I553_8875 [Mycobacterium xenopi 4042]|uniref:Uncharacterized protein n=1 Tax=Mycobacterium xenopi 4042 TaxID=1299334 RepID=X8CLY4_MYCXE|nr:hypothetical protein I553_8875 [Mycobacterium xenopi 4042]
MITPTVAEAGSRRRARARRSGAAARSRCCQPRATAAR